MPLHKIQGYQGHQNVSKRRPHHSGDIIMYNKGKQFENQFFIYGPKCKKNVYFGGILGTLRGSSMIRLDLSCFPAMLSPIYIYTYEIGKHSDKKF